tara:strand:- start:187 stop:294 length:108 start_codon:yes stop_codon:yes gene_type:complete
MLVSPFALDRFINIFEGGLGGLPSPAPELYISHKP